MTTCGCGCGAEVRPSSRFKRGHGTRVYPESNLDELKVRPDAHLWEQLLNESTVAFAAFREYRDQGLSRTHEATAARVGKSVQLIGRWSRAYLWVARARAYDTHMDKLVLESRAASIAARERSETLDLLSATEARELRRQNAALTAENEALRRELAEVRGDLARLERSRADERARRERRAAEPAMAVHSEEIG